MTTLSEAYRRGSDVNVVVSGARGASDYQLWRLAGNNGSYDDYLNFLANRVIAYAPGFKGDKGDPGGTPMAVGLFTQIADIEVDDGYDRIITSGRSTVGVGAATYRRVPVVETLPTSLEGYSWTTDAAGVRWSLDVQIIDAAMLGPVGAYPTDSAPAINKALEFAAGREVHLPVGTINCAARIFRQTQGNVEGVKLIGAGDRSTIIEFDFNSDTQAALEIDGATLETYRFQYNVKLVGFTIKPRAGRKIVYGLELTGCWKPYLEGFRATGFRSNAGTFGAGWYVRKRAGLNPDAYATVSAYAFNCSFMDNYRGVLADTGQGFAGATFEKCALQANDADGFKGVSITGLKFPECQLAYNGSRAVSLTAATTSGSNQITVSGTVPADAEPGREIRGPGIPPWTVIQSVAGQVITLCRLGTHNGVLFTGVPAPSNATATQAAATLTMTGGYGVNTDGIYEGEAGDIDLSNVEGDGNTTGLAYIYAYGVVRGYEPRVISRRLNGIERSVAHFVFDQSRPTRRVDLQGVFSRIDTVLTEQNPEGFSHPVILFSGGTRGDALLNAKAQIRALLKGTTFTATTVNGSNQITVTNAGNAGFREGQVVEGTGIPVGAQITNIAGNVLTLSANATAAGSATFTLTVPLTIGDAAWTQARWRNQIILPNGNPLTPTRDRFYIRATPTQAFTTSNVALTANPANTGWPAPTLGTTGKIVTDWDGAIRWNARATVNGTASGDRFIFQLFKNGAVVRDEQDDVFGAGRKRVAFEHTEACVVGDEFWLEIRTNVASRSLLGSWQLEVEAV